MSPQEREAAAPARVVPALPNAEPEVVVDAQIVPLPRPAVVATQPSLSGPAANPAPRSAMKPRPPVTAPPNWLQQLPAIPSPPGLPSAVINPTRMSQSLMERYEQAVEAQKQFMKSLMGR